MRERERERGGGGERENTVMDECMLTNKRKDKNDRYNEQHTASHGQAV